MVTTPANKHQRRPRLPKPALFSSRSQSSSDQHRTSQSIQPASDAPCWCRRMLCLFRPPCATATGCRCRHVPSPPRACRDAALMHALGSLHLWLESPFTLGVRGDDEFDRYVAGNRQTAIPTPVVHRPETEQASSRAVLSACNYRPLESLRGPYRTNHSVQQPHPCPHTLYSHMQRHQSFPLRDSVSIHPSRVLPHTPKTTSKIPCLESRWRLAFFP
ncbi:hypothetical protein B0J11DRAFT_537714 [Dendryphion nanum]|uniref:Uncharacterized protein n=1 Tax=Dendryphion nanum TaxID=256645 RepID=A0A9P9IEW0_9PLEO|nr:hypothetical protein B0J11DRAFT_537714 [Dendryphion nanum]